MRFWLFLTFGGHFRGLKGPLEVRIEDETHRTMYGTLVQATLSQKKDWTRLAGSSGKVKILPDIYWGIVLASNHIVCHMCSTIFSSVRSSNSHPDLLLIHPPTHFFRPHRSSTQDFHFLSHYSYIKAIMLCKGNHWTRCAGFMDASWVRLGITNDDLGTSWELPGDNLGKT